MERAIAKSRDQLTANVGREIVRRRIVLQNDRKREDALMKKKVAKTLVIQLSRTMRFEIRQPVIIESTKAVAAAVPEIE